MKRLRRSMLFVPGNNPGMLRDAYIYGSDSIMFDLEDSVSFREKDAARFLVYNALTSINYGTKELVVRINDLQSGLGIQDLEAIVRARPHVIRLPKTETA
ncbi:MAG: citrate lyase subunit beta, partial [Clostridiales bacterium]